MKWFLERRRGVCNIGRKEVVGVVRSGKRGKSSQQKGADISKSGRREGWCGGCGEKRVLE